MPKRFDELAPCAALAEIGRDFHARGWMAGTAGNLSARVSDKDFWVTASGMPKGQLDELDFVRVDVTSGEVVEKGRETNKPSAETAIHQVIYRLFDDARACLHVHTVDAVIATEVEYSGSVLLPNIEMIKGFDIWEQEPKVFLPVFENTLDVSKIAVEIEKQFKNQTPQISALMIRGHGLTVWGRTLQEAYNRVEIAEFIMSFIARKRSL